MVEVFLANWPDVPVGDSTARPNYNSDRTYIGRNRKTKALISRKEVIVSRKSQIANRKSKALIGRVEEDGNRKLEIVSWKS